MKEELDKNAVPGGGAFFTQSASPTKGKGSPRTGLRRMRMCVTVIQQSGPPGLATAAFGFHLVLLCCVSF